MLIRVSITTLSPVISSLRFQTTVRMKVAVMKVYTNLVLTHQSLMWDFFHMFTARYSLM